MEKLKRYELINQLLILEKLYPEDSDYYSRDRKALENGYALHYAWINDRIPDGLTVEQCTEVLEILEMYRSLLFSFQENSSSKEVPQRLKFEGFDGNHETALMGYVQYFVIELKRFEELTYGKEFPTFNSHRPMLEKYRRMLSVWRDFDFFLSEDQIESVLEA